jgi:hypothetical protein
MKSGDSLGQLSSSYSAAVLAKKPAGYWRLGEMTGQAAGDSSGNGHVGIYHGNPVYQEKGAISIDTDTAIKLDGKCSYIEIPSHKDFSQPTSGNGLSVEVWLRPDALEFEGQKDDYIHWLGKGEAKKQEWALRFYSRTSKDRPNRISAYLFNPEGGLGAGAYFEDTLELKTWMHIVACFDPGDADTKNAGVSIYKNGLFRSGPPSPEVLYNHCKWQIKPVVGNAPLRLGTRNPRDKKSFLIGALDEVAIYPRVLTAQEILENYEIGIGKTTT